MAHKKVGGSTKNTGDSNPKYLGVKKTHGESVKAGSVLVRQRGTRIQAGKGVGVGKDHTLFALTSGVLKVAERRVIDFTSSIKRKKIMMIEDR